MNIYSYMFKLQSPSKHSSFGIIHLSKWFFHCSKLFLNLLILIPFHECFCLFLFHCFSSSKTFPFKNCVHLGKQKSHLGQDCGSGVMLFWVKNCWTLSAVWEGALVNHLSWNGQTQVFKTEAETEAKTQPFTAMPANTLI